MNSQIQLGDISVDVTLKDIKNIHLSVHPPMGRIRVVAPKHVKPDAIRIFILSKLGWIKKQQRKLREQERESPREYLDRESHYVWGKRYLLKIIEDVHPPSVELTHRYLILRVRFGTDQAKKQSLIEAWYREQLREAIPTIIAKWGPVVGVDLKGFYVQRMKTKWGSCNPYAQTIRLNTDLAKKPQECLEYIIVHEMAHMFTTKHNDQFIALMDKAMPRWQFRRQTLNRLPVRHEHWGN